MISPERASRLAHDVGKYVARTARNLPDGDVPADLVAMLARDLWDAPAGGRASAVFATLAGDATGPAELERARAALAAIDALEPAVRRGDQTAVREAARLALAVETLLRGLARIMRPAP